MQQLEEARRLDAEGLSTREIARRVGVRDGVTVFRWLRGRMPHAHVGNTRGNLFKPKAGHEALCVGKAFLLGVLCGDGHISHSGGSWRLELCVTDRDFAESFSAAIEAVYGAKAPIYARKTDYYVGGEVFHVSVGSRLICEDMRRFVPNQACMEWKVPVEVALADEAQRCAFLRGFADSEGTVTDGKVKLASSNRPGLEGVQALLKRIGVESNIHEYTDKTYKKQRLVLYVLASSRSWRRRSNMADSIVVSDRAYEVEVFPLGQVGLTKAEQEFLSSLVVPPAGQNSLEQRAREFGCGGYMKVEFDFGNGRKGGLLFRRL